MNKGVCHLSIVPVRANATDQAEIVTQLLFGEMIEILDKDRQWLKIRCEYDAYEGWIDNKQVLAISEHEYQQMTSFKPHMCNEFVGLVENVSMQTTIPIVIGSSLPNLSGTSFSLGDRKYEFKGERVQHPAVVNRSHIIEAAMMYRNAPYLWGGRSPFGIDCSGFTQMVFKLNGIKLLRDASQQATQGEIVNLITESRPGDLAFFDNADGRIIHVGILLGDNKIIHAAGKVRIDAIDHQGIFNLDTQSYSHQLRLIKNLMPY